MNSIFQIKNLLQKEGWQHDVFITVDGNGKITAIDKKSKEQPTTILHDFVLPGFQNAHSHAFQYAMAGMAEVHSANVADDFWSWRNAMYQLAATLNPDEIEAIAAMLYAEMIRHGYTNVAEFHYLHHDVKGNPYQNLAEIGERLVAAAQQAGIQITLVPIFYQKGGFNQPPGKLQKRFICESTDDYLKLWEASQAVCQQYIGANIGVGVHSIRAVDQKSLLETAAQAPQNIPFHIHVAEQLKEVEASLAYLGQRPVEFLLNELDINERFHFVHATHLTVEETIQLAQSRANVVLCPTTEGNLGDGLFPFGIYKNCGGNWSIGTDSHVGLSPFEELRLLDYGQRLVTHKRNIFTSENQLDSGQNGIQASILGGRKAMNHFSTQFFEVGCNFNAVVMDAESPLLACTDDKYLASTMLYTGDVSMVKGTLVNGRYITKNEDTNYQSIKSRFIKTIKKLKSRV
jgi:formimidoylglutamate deiminase